MRLGIRMLAVLALLGCSSNDIPVPTGTTTSTTADVTGSWTLTWGPMAGTFTVIDTTQLIIDTTVDNTVAPPDTTIDTTAVTKNRLVGDTCNASGTMTVTQASPIADVTGTYTVTRTCSGAGTVVGTNPLIKTDSVWKSVVTGSNVFYFFLDSATFHQGQQATVTGNSMSGVAVWTNVSFTHAPKHPAAAAVPLTGTFSATRP